MAQRDRTGWLGREDSNLRMAESKSALLNLSFDGLSDMRSPKIECFFPFFKEFMPLVDGRYARNRTVSNLAVRNASMASTLALLGGFPASSVSCPLR
jgi:hypothetical protein